MTWEEDNKEEYWEEPVPLNDPIGLPTFHDLNLPDRAYRWMRLKRREYNGPALELAFCGKQEHGELPEWLEGEDFPFFDILNHSIGTNLVEWGLKNGMSPGEPFLVQACQPIYRTSNDFEEPEWHGGIVRRLRRSLNNSLKSWSFLLDEIEKSKELRKTDVRAMRVKYWDYNSDRLLPWDVSLISNHGGVCLCMAFGKTKEESLRALMTQVVRKFPDEVLQKMVRKFFQRCPLTRGERLIFQDPLRD